MDRIKIAKQEEQEAFLQTCRDVYKHHEKTFEVDSVPKMLALLRKDIRHGYSECNGELSVAVFTKTNLMPILEKTVALLPQPQCTADLFGETRRLAVAEGMADSGFGLRYMFSNPNNLWSAFCSTWIGKKLFGKIFPFDPKGVSKNISGLLFQETFEDKSIDWTVGPTPTLGDHLAPEMKRALEFLPHSEYEKWIYVNLQSLSSSSERGRSLALLQASRTYKDRFCAASISVDSPLYRCEKLSISLIDQKKMLLEQLSKSIFENDTSWYFFSLSGKKREEWWNVAKEIVDEAFSLTEDPKAFHELVVLGLIRGWQAFNMPKKGKVVSTIACKECIDRGGSVNAAFQWAFLGDDVDEITRAAKVMAILWGRPLLARGRLIEKCRSRGFEALVKNLSPSVVRNFLHKVWEFIG